MLVSRVVDGASVVLGAAVVDSSVELGFSEVEVEWEEEWEEEWVMEVGSGLVEVDRAFVEEVVGAVEIWETWMVVVDFADPVGSEEEMLMVASPEPLPEAPPPAMVKGFENWNCSGSETSWSLMP